MATYFSYAEQTAHYFRRPHEKPLESPSGGPAAWRGADLATSDVWRQRLDAPRLEEIEAALAHAEATGRPTEALRAEDFPLPTIAADIAAWRDEIDAGRGFQVVSGLPVERWTDAQAERVFWCLGLHMGTPGAQNPQGDLLGHVRDTGDDATDPYVRLYRTRSDIAYHCDAADVVGLLCLRAARRGGASRIVSSVTVYDELLRRRPDLAPRLYEPFLLDVRNEDRSGALRAIPIPPCRYAAGRLRTFYHSDYFRSVQRHADVPRFTDAERTLLDLYESIAAEPALALEMALAPGDIQWLSNHTILHARTAYEDHDHPARKRHLLRLWLSIDRND
jgi:hypothetical protein